MRQGYTGGSTVFLRVFRFPPLAALLMDMCFRYKKDLRKTLRTRPESSARSPVVNMAVTAAEVPMAIQILTLSVTIAERFRGFNEMVDRSSPFIDDLTPRQPPTGF